MIRTTRTICLLAVCAGLLCLSFKFSSTRQRVDVRVLYYTNDVSGLKACVQLINLSADPLSWGVAHTKYLTNGVWVHSARQPADQDISRDGCWLIPAQPDDTRVFIPVPPEAKTWRLEFIVVRAFRSKIEMKMPQVTQALKIPVFSHVVSKEFEW
jgi:hypothetical protein